jgi:hypothetical protein
MLLDVVMCPVLVVAESKKRDHIFPACSLHDSDLMLKAS